MEGILQENRGVKMSFRKEIVIYKGKTSRVYINQCHNKGKKTKLFAIRKDDKTGLMDLLGLIKFNGKWRQYVFYPEKETYWNSSCMKNIAQFIEELR